MAQIVWNTRASKQFTDIQDYLEKEFGENAVRKFTSYTFSFLEILSKYPQIGSLENAAKNIRGFLLHRHTTIFYAYKEDTIYILSFFDNRQRPSKKQL